MALMHRTTAGESAPSTQPVAMATSPRIILRASSPPAAGLWQQQNKRPQISSGPRNNRTRQSDQFCLPGGVEL